jgi:tRNA dimethylallyltransferase
MANVKKTAIIIAGPTAVGKTRVAIELAKHFHTEIISADSRQCYKELNIGVARPSPSELAEVPHHFIASHSVHEHVNAAVFAAYALEQAAKIFEHSDFVVVAGGTGLYIKAFCEGLDVIPEVPAAIREQLAQDYNSKGIVWLQEEIKKTDPLFFETGEIKNPHRLMRALEVIKTTGSSIVEFQKKNLARRDFSILRVGLELPREILYERINHRVDQMMNAGLLAEVTQLLPVRDLKALHTVGYDEIFDSLEGKTSLEFAVSKIKQHSRNYAKRQLTWFHNDENWNWFDPEMITLSSIEKLLNK